jgi:hypothetical protein
MQFSRAQTLAENKAMGVEEELRKKREFYEAFPADDRGLGGGSAGRRPTWWRSSTTMMSRLSERPQYPLRQPHRPAPQCGLIVVDISEPEVVPRPVPAVAVTHFEDGPEVPTVVPGEAPAASKKRTRGGNTKLD